LIVKNFQLIQLIEKKRSPGPVDNCQLKNNIKKFDQFLHSIRFEFLMSTYLSAFLSNPNSLTVYPVQNLPYSTVSDVNVVLLIDSQLGFVVFLSFINKKLASEHHRKKNIILLP
jgi:hypothetical protein